jgi:hypothetical protein
MKKGVKIALGVGIPLGLFATYWWGVRNRRPKLKFEAIDWENNNGVVKFGKTVNPFDLHNGKSFSAGASFNPNKYNASISSDGNKVKFDVYKENHLIETQTIDFAKKLIY